MRLGKERSRWADCALETVPINGFERVMTGRGDNAVDVAEFRGPLSPALVTSPQG